MITAKQRQQAYKALGDYQREGAIGDINAVGRALAGESDRGMVVILGSLTENLLLDEIVKRLPALEPAQLSNLTRPGGVLSGWADGVNFARAIGIIADQDADRLEALKSMRNACAHSRRPIDFRTEQLLAVMAMMFDAPPDSFQDLNDRLGARILFIIAVTLLWDVISGHDPAAPENARLDALIEHALDAAEPLPSRDILPEQPSPDDATAPTAKAPPHPHGSSSE